MAKLKQDEVVGLSGLLPEVGGQYGTPPMINRVHYPPLPLFPKAKKAREDAMVNATMPIAKIEYEMMPFEELVTGTGWNRYDADREKEHRFYARKNAEQLKWQEDPNLIFDFEVIKARPEFQKWVAEDATGEYSDKNKYKWERIWELHRDDIIHVAKKTGQPIAMVLGQLMREGWDPEEGGDPNSAGAAGIGQFTDIAANDIDQLLRQRKYTNWLQKYGDYKGKVNWENIVKNQKLGLIANSMLMDHVMSMIGTGDWRLGLAAYNGGTSVFRRWGFDPPAHVKLPPGKRKEAQLYAYFAPRYAAEIHKALYESDEDYQKMYRRMKRNSISKK